MVPLPYPSLPVVGLPPSPGWKADPWTFQTPLPLPSPAFTIIHHHIGTCCRTGLLKGDEEGGQAARGDSDMPSAGTSW